MAEQGNAYRRRAGVDAWQGQKFEWGLTVLAYLRCQRLHEEFKKNGGKSGIKSFLVANNVDGAGNFDDVVVRVEYVKDNELKNKVIFVQCKHITKPTKGQKLFPTFLGDEKSIKMFFDLFNGIKTCKMECECDINDIKFKKINIIAQPNQISLKMFLNRQNLDLEVLLYSNIGFKEEKKLGGYQIINKFVTDTDITATLFNTAEEELFELHLTENDAAYSRFEGQNIMKHLFSEEFRIFLVQAENLEKHIDEEIKLLSNTTVHINSLRELAFQEVQIHFTISNPCRSLTEKDDLLRHITNFIELCYKGKAIVDNFCKNNCVKNIFSEQAIDYFHILLNSNYEHVIKLQTNFPKFEKLKFLQVMLSKYKLEFTSLFIDDMHDIEKWKLARKSFTYQKLDKVYVYVSIVEVSKNEDKRKNEIIIQILENVERQLTLADYSQEFKIDTENYILNKKVCFQGNITDIKSLCGDNWKMVFDEKLVCDILENKLLEISTPLPSLESYVPRTFIKEILNLEYYIDRTKTWNINGDCIILFSEENECIPGHNADYKVFKNMEEIRIFVQNLVVKDKDKGSFHLCSHTNDKLQWFYSFGNKSGYTKIYIIGEDDITNGTKSKISVLSDVAGMGKTTTLLSLARNYKKKNPSHWVFFIELNKYLDFFKNVNEISSTEFAVHFIGTTLLNLETTELLLFTEACESGNSALFFDAFDEISPDAEECFPLLLSALEKTSIRNIIVSSRPNFASSLEETLLLKSIKFQGLTTKEKELTLEGYWKQMLRNEGKIVNDNLLKQNARNTVALLQLEQDFLSEILAIPLQIRVVAIVYYELLSKIYSEEPVLNLSSVNLAALYEQFIILHAERFFVDKHKMKWINVKLDQKKRFIQDKLKGAEEIACQIIIPEVLKNDTFDRMKEISALCDDVGIITHKSPIVFLHRTVAEYLAAKYLFRKIFCKLNIADTQIVTKILVDDKFNIVRKFINSLLIGTTVDIFGHYQTREFDIIREISDKTPLYVSASEGNVEIIRQIASNNAFLNMRNSYGKTVLLCACEYGKNEAVKLLLSYKDCSVNICDNAGYTVLHTASRRGNIEIIQLILHRDSYLINRQNRNGFTALHTACYLRNREVAKILLSHKDCSVNICDNGGNTVLHIASWRVDIEIMQLIIQRDSSPINMQDNTGFTPLLEACINGKKEAAKLLLSHKDCSVNICDNDGDTVFHTASKSSDIEIMQLLLEKDRSSLNMQNNRGFTPLHLACFHRNSEVVKLLFSCKDCTVNICDNGGKTVLHVASWKVDIEIMQLILQRASSPLNMQDYMGFTPLLEACKNGKKEAAKLLLSHKDCSVNICDIDGDTVFHAASMSGDIEIMQLLLEKDTSSLNMRNSKGLTPLHLACFHRNSEVVKLLFSCKDCTVNICDNDGNTVLHVTSMQGDVEIMHLILQHDSSLLNMQNNLGFTPLHKACRSGHTEASKLLLSHKYCTVNICDNGGDTLLHAASMSGDIEITQHILEKDRSSLNMRNNRGFTPLHAACYHRKSEAAILLFRQRDCPVDNCDNDGDTLVHVTSMRGDVKIMHLILQRNRCLINMKNKRGFTPLHKACCYGKIEPVKYLLAQRDCMVNKRDFSRPRGLTALDVARMDGYTDIIELLLERGAKEKRSQCTYV